jgi:hypothetical protein
MDKIEAYIRARGVANLKEVTVAMHPMQRRTVSRRINSLARSIRIVSVGKGWSGSGQSGQPSGHSGIESPSDGGIGSGQSGQHRTKKNTVSTEAEEAGYEAKALTEDFWAVAGPNEPIVTDAAPLTFGPQTQAVAHQVANMDAARDALVPVLQVLISEIKYENQKRGMHLKIGRIGKRKQRVPWERLQWALDRLEAPNMSITDVMSAVQILEHAGHLDKLWKDYHPADWSLIDFLYPAPLPRKRKPLRIDEPEDCNLDRDECYELALQEGCLNTVIDQDGNEVYIGAKPVES